VTILARTNTTAPDEAMRREVIEAFLVCPGCKKDDLFTVSFLENQGDILDGVVACGSCRNWYRVEGGLLELLMPSLQDATRKRAFRNRFESMWDGWSEDEGSSLQQSGDAHKQDQKAFYDEDALSYETQMLRLPFWNAQTAIYLQTIRSFASGCGVVLEVGCGTGRISLPLGDVFEAILSFDISESMVRIAQEKRDHGAHARTLHYFIGDAENIPVKSGVIDVAIFSGILHHLENPQIVIADTVRTLVPDGRFLGIENNSSAFRFIFDFLMRRKRLWNEKAHEEHFIINRKELQRWFGQSGVSVKTWTTIFLPPHLLNFFRVAQVERLIRATDAICQRLPWLNLQGGLILFAGRKVPGDKKSH
jgi:ubiquinone/menaquinone biosynthesis C-methylase UbiE/uncharacterized protein YbaR (Trm112 family)